MIKLFGLIFIICTSIFAGCNFSDIESSKSEDINVIPEVENGTEKPFVPGHTHDWSYKFIGGDPVCHKIECSVCGFVYSDKEQCYSTIYCKDCGHSTNQSNYKTDFFVINENIKKLYVIANKGFENSDSLRRYIEYKKKKINVEVKYFSSETLAINIRDYLKQEYIKEQSMAVLLIGKSGNTGYCIPEFKNRNQPEIQGQKRVAATDFWYGFYEEKTDDIFPQAMVGRLPAGSEEELKAMVDKIMNVESEQSNTQQNKNILLVQQKDSAGKMPFSDESTEIQNYFSNKNASKFNIKLAYTIDSNQVNTYIREGALLISYSGHGGPDFWGDSRYNVNHIKTLRNDVYPVVLGITCNSANYTYGNGCVAEAFMRNSSGGAVGYIGASAVMIADFSKIATIGYNEVCGIIKSVFNESNGSNNYKVTTLGGMHQAALRAIKISKIPYSDISKGYSIEILNLFGDPTMSIQYMQ